MKSKVYNLNGEKVREVELPKCFSAKKIRKDIVAKVVETKKSEQPYAPALNAGKQHSAKGQLVHRRHVWKSQYGRGMSRVPRKRHSRRGTQFNWVGAFSPNTRGGMRAHPPKVIARMGSNSINKNEMKIALISALTATTMPKEISIRYETIREKMVKEAPFVFEVKESVKVKDLLSSLKKVLGKELYKIAIRERSQRAGKGKLRGRKYKSNAGALLVIGKDEKVKTSKLEVVKATVVGVTELANGGTGRLTIYTENALKELNDRFEKKEVGEKKK